MTHILYTESLLSSKTYRSIMIKFLKTYLEIVNLAPATDDLQIEKERFIHQNINFPFFLKNQNNFIFFEKNKSGIYRRECTTKINTI